MKTIHFLLIWIVVISIGLSVDVPKPAVGQAQIPDGRTLLKPMPSAIDTSANGVLKFRLPYDYKRVIEWVSGPHPLNNSDGFASVAVGQGSGLDFAAPLNDPNPNFEIANMAAGIVLQVNNTTECVDSPGKAGFGCWVAVQEPTYNTVIIYAHLRPNTIAVTPNAPVFQGQYLGQAGQSGGQATIHLHLDLRDKDFNCPTLDNCNWGSPLGWEKTALILDKTALILDNYSINGFFTTSDKTSIQNYDGSALYDPAQTFLKKEIVNFPYVDWGGANFTQGKRVQAIAATNTDFACDPKSWVCDTNSDNRTQFAGKGRVSGGGSGSSFHEPGTGALISTNILVKLPYAEPISGVEFCGVTNYGYPCVTHTWTSDNACINLATDQMAERVNSLHFLGDYVGNFEALLFAGPNCQPAGTSYTLDAATLGSLNNLVGSVKIIKHSPITIIGSIDLYREVGYTGTSQSYTWTSNETCIDLNLTGMSDQSKSIRFTNGYIGNYNVIAYAGNQCQGGSTAYVEDMPDFGPLSNSFSSIKILQHIYLVPNGNVELYADSDFGGSSLPFQYISDAHCYDLTSLPINQQANSFRFRNGYINEFDILFYKDNACQVFAAQYGQDVSDFGSLNDQFSSVKLAHRGPFMPDLVPYPATGSGEPVVISKEPGSTVNTILVSGQNAWVSWGGKNIGDAKTAGGHYIELLVDGQQMIKYPFPILYSGTWEGFTEWGLGSNIAPGWHRIDLIVDSTHVLGETNITNNTWTGMFFWNPAPYLLNLPVVLR